jgi:5-methylcytosine-specific restriction endonuclease McrA
MTKLNIRVNKLAKLNIGPRPICPICNVKECTIGKKKKDGTYSFQSMCTPCKHKHLEQKNGVKYAVRCAQNAGCNSIKENNDRIAKENGFSSHKSYTTQLNLQNAKENGFSSYKAYADHLNLQNAKENGFKTYRAYRDHLNLQLALDNGYSNYKGYNDALKHQLALDNGYSNYVDYANSKHPYRKYRKTYCENIDERLGYKCTSTITMIAQLDVDHIDGNARNNKKENLQTLCKCCHTHKTITEKDYLTPGRKTLGIKY